MCIIFIANPMKLFDRKFFPIYGISLPKRFGNKSRKNMSLVRIELTTFRL